MPIRVLPPILANQIAAGEVVERPASVVKELIENSLDAGADRIEVELEKGGCKLIRIRDNGGGIPKDELVLALQRHATSKVSTLDDLEAIISLGFRGEALASSRSVARLTRPSRTAEHAEAWQASAEGRDMAVSLRPAAHPVGTTVDVVDLFFNTPARRRFLRSEKTEFGHIDELLRRLALSRADVSLLLRHNGKLVRQYRAVRGTGLTDLQQRVLAVCGKEFLSQALHLHSEHHGLTLSGWILPPPAVTDSTPEVQYFYVNGRMMRDRLIAHAIRQGYLEALGVECSPSFLLYLQLDPHQVDVNVHPAKHEVRFHESRLVHDFVVSVVRGALDEGMPLPGRHGMTESETITSSSPVTAEPGAAYQSAAAAPSRSQLRGHDHGYQRRIDGHAVSSPVSRAYSEAHHQLMTSLPLSMPSSAAQPDSVPWRFLSGLQDDIALIADTATHGVRLVHLRRLWCAFQQQQLLEQWQRQGVVSQPLLMPVSLPLTTAQWEGVATYADELKQMGVEWQKQARNLVLYRVPACLRNSDVSQRFCDLLAQLAVDHGAEMQRAEVLCHWLAQQADFSLPDEAAIVRLLNDCYQLHPELFELPFTTKVLDLTQPLQDLLNA